ncbi:hypothetical protein BJY00DRAFT_290895 [Aspergillus carlsbadensis]|nr:hypothetical protein BJY00DRAFT_290895 [Aspergillus carlsbadensis]
MNLLPAVPALSLTPTSTSTTRIMTRTPSPTSLHTSIMILAISMTMTTISLRRGSNGHILRVGSRTRASSYSANTWRGRGGRGCNAVSLTRFMALVTTLAVITTGRMSSLRATPSVLMLAVASSFTTVSVSMAISASIRL